MWSFETLDTLYGVPNNEWFVNQKFALDAFVDDSFIARFVWFNVHTISLMCSAITVRHKWIEILYPATAWTAHDVWYVSSVRLHSPHQISCTQWIKQRELMHQWKHFIVNQRSCLLCGAPQGICVPLCVRLTLINYMIKGYIFGIFVKNMSFIKWSIFFLLYDWDRDIYWNWGILRLYYIS